MKQRQIGDYSVDEFFVELMDVLLERCKVNNWSPKNLKWAMTELDLYSQNVYSVVRSDTGYEISFMAGTSATTFAMPALWFYHSILNKPISAKFNGVLITLQSDGS